MSCTGTVAKISVLGCYFEDGKYSSSVIGGQVNVIDVDACVFKGTTSSSSVIVSTVSGTELSVKNTIFVNVETSGPIINCDG